MPTEKKKGLFSKLFGSGKSGCCNTKIEEVVEDEDGKDTQKQSRADKSQEDQQGKKS